MAKNAPKGSKKDKRRKPDVEKQTVRDLPTGAKADAVKGGAGRKAGETPLEY